MHYVYIIQSLADGSYYKGASEDPLKRLDFHNVGLSTYTAKKKPWKLVAIFSFESKKEALQKERRLKKYGKASLKALIASNQNKLEDYMGRY
ncbi:MAG: GIY-YIG nuclease family protein [Ferruginibacter sp.]